MTPRTIKLNAHRTLTYYTPEDVERIIAERDAALADALREARRSGVSN